MCKEHVASFTLFPLELYIYFPLMNATFWQPPYFLMPRFDAGLVCCDFGLFTTITIQVAMWRVTVHDCIILKLDIMWFTCVNNKRKSWVDLPKFKMADRCVHFLLDLRTSIFCIILTTNKVKHTKKTINYLFI